MPEKDGAEEKSTKSVVNKKQKQMMGEEGYDIARDMGRVPKTRDKRDATTMPPSKEMEKTRKVYKGPSALELVKKKYKGQIMDVSKKKANEELDLTQVAEAFGGYIIEAVVTSDADRKTRKTGRVESRRERENRERREDEARQKRFGSTGRDIMKKYGRKPVGSGSTKDEVKAKPGERDATLELIRKYQTTGTGVGGNIPDFPKNLSSFRTTKQFKDFMDRQMGRTPDIETNTREQSKKFGEKLKNQQDRVTSGDERPTDKPIITGDVPKRDRVTGGQDRATDTRSSVYIPKPEEIEKIKPKPETKPETKRQRNKRVRTAANQIISDIRTGKDKTVKTKTEVPPPPPPKPPKPPTTGGFGKRFGDFRKFTRRNPALSLIGFDAIKSVADTAGNILDPANLGLRGGRVGRRSARQ